MLLRHARQHRDGGCRQRPGAAHVDVQTIVGGGDLDIERLSDRYQRLGDGPARVQRAAQAGGENGAAIDRNNVVRVGGGKAHFEHVVGAHPGVQRNPPAPGAMTIDQRRHFAGKLRLRQRFDHEVALPCAVGIGFPVLDRASPADSKMLAKWRNPLRACTRNLQQAPAVGMTRYGRNLDGLAGERVWHVHRQSVGEGYAVAAMPDVIDDEAFNHGARR